MQTFKILRCGFVAINVYDLFRDYKEILNIALRATSLQLGRKDGDVLAVPLGRLELPVDVIISGPPCPPWSSSGVRKGHVDPRADVFAQVLRWVIHFIKSGGLLIALLENVVGTMQKLSDCDMFMKRVVSCLRSEVPEFEWGIERRDTYEFQLPQHRERVYLRGMRRKFCPCGKIPAPLDPFGPARLVDFLDVLPNISRQDLATNIRKNLGMFELRIKAAVASGKIAKVFVAICSYSLIVPGTR